MTATRTARGLGTLIGLGLAGVVASAVGGPAGCLATNTREPEERHTVRLVVRTEPAGALRIHWQIGGHTGVVPRYVATRWINRVTDARVGDPVTLDARRLDDRGQLVCVIEQDGAIVRVESKRDAGGCRVTHVVTE